MAKEIERKFLVVDSSFLAMAVKSYAIAQGYLSSSKDATVRVRIRDDEAFITIKSKTRGCIRGEWEYQVPKQDGEEMMALCATRLEKTRHIVPFAGHTWEVDVFHGKLADLVIAEIELSTVDEAFDIPPFCGEEVTGNPAYYNSSLAQICAL